MEMDTSIGIACGMMQEWEAMALRDQSGARTIGAPWARSGDGKYPDCNRCSEYYGTLLEYLPQANIAKMI